MDGDGLFRRRREAGQVAAGQSQPDAAAAVRVRGRHVDELR